MTPLDPATMPGRQKSDFPAMAANVIEGRAEAQRWSLPTLPHVNLGMLVREKEKILMRGKGRGSLHADYCWIGFCETNDAVGIDIDPSCYAGEVVYKEW